MVYRSRIFWNMDIVLCAHAYYRLKQIVVGTFQTLVDFFGHYEKVSLCVLLYLPQCFPNFSRLAPPSHAHMRKRTFFVILVCFKLGVYVLCTGVKQTFGLPTRTLDYVTKLLFPFSFSFYKLQTCFFFLVLMTCVLSLRFCEKTKLFINYS